MCPIIHTSVDYFESSHITDPFFPNVRTLMRIAREAPYTNVKINE